MNSEPIIVPGQSCIPSAGQGAFLTRSVKRGLIYRFVGDIISYETYEKDEDKQGYAVALRDGSILQCYDTRFSGDCLASLANCTWDTKLRPTCRLAYDKSGWPGLYTPKDKGIQLKMGQKIELLYSYGKGYKHKYTIGANK